MQNDIDVSELAYYIKRNIERADPNSLSLKESEIIVAMEIFKGK